MSEIEIFNIFYGKEKKDIWKKFLDIENSIEEENTLYVYYDMIRKMLLDDKEYIKMRGFRLICRLSKWDIENKIDRDIDILLGVLNSSKPTIVRQCLASLNILLLYKKNLFDVVNNKLINLNLDKYKDTMRPLIKKDIDDILHDL